MEIHIPEMFNELHQVKQQLAVAEEQNACLANENKKIYESLQSEQQTNKQLQLQLENEQLKFRNKENQLENYIYDLSTKLDTASRINQGRNREIIQQLINENLLLNESLRLNLLPLRDENKNLKEQLQKLSNINQEFLIKQQFYEHKIREDEIKHKNIIERTMWESERIHQEKNQQIRQLIAILNIAEESSISLSSFDVNEMDSSNQEMAENTRVDGHNNCYNFFINKIFTELLENLQYQMDKTDELDLCVENLSIIPEENIRNLSTEEMQEIFTSFASTYPTNIRSFKKRYNDQRKLYSEQIVKYLKYLTESINLLLEFEKSRDKHVFTKVYNKLDLLREITLDVVKSSEKRGLLHYEKRAATMWNFVVNYVAVLTKEIKKESRLPHQ